MATFLFHVKETFGIQDRAFVVISDRVIRDCHLRLHISDEIEIRNTTIPSVRTHVVGIEMCSPGREIALVLPVAVSKTDVELGAEIWRVVDDDD